MPRIGADVVGSIPGDDVNLLNTFGGNIPSQIQLADSLIVNLNCFNSPPE